MAAVFLEGFLKVFDLMSATELLPLSPLPSSLWYRSTIIMIINMNKHEMHLFMNRKLKRKKKGKCVRILQSVNVFVLKFDVHLPLASQLYKTFFLGGCQLFAEPDSFLIDCRQKTRQIDQTAFSFFFFYFLFCPSCS